MTTPAVEEPTTLAAPPPDTPYPVPVTVDAAPAVAGPPFLVKRGDFVRILVTHGSTASALLALVTGIAGPSLPPEHQGENGEPALTVVYLPSTANPRVLSSSGWYQELARFGPVYHQSAALAQSGIVWTDVIPGDSIEHGISMAAIALPDTTAAAAAVLQRDKAMGVGGGPVADARVPQSSGSATEAAGLSLDEENALAAAKSGPLPAPTRHWPPLDAKMGVPLQPGAPTPAELDNEAAAKLEGQPATE